MVQPLISLDFTSSKPADFSFDFGSFASTTITVKPETEAGQALFAEMFGAGCVSVELPKSKGEDFAVFVERKGLKVA
jgi:hypothetical protein